MPAQEVGSLLGAGSGSGLKEPRHIELVQGSLTTAPKHGWAWFVGSIDLHPDHEFQRPVAQWHSVYLPGELEIKRQDTINLL